MPRYAWRLTLVTAVHLADTFRTVIKVGAIKAITPRIAQVATPEAILGRIPVTEVSPEHDTDIVVLIGDQKIRRTSRTGVQVLV